MSGAVPLIPSYSFLLFSSTSVTYLLYLSPTRYVRNYSPIFIMYHV